MKITGVNKEYSIHSEVGGKAKGLLFLLEQNVSTPPFFLLDFDTLTAIKNHNTTFTSLINEWKLAAEIRDDQLWAVRSSTAMEDGVNKSFAGQFTTKINVYTTELEEAILEVLNSYTTENSYSEAAASYGIIIQEMLDPDYSGVLFTRNPVDLLNNEPVINIIPGLGEKMVSGEFLSYQMVYQDGEIIPENCEEKYTGEKYAGNTFISISKTPAEIEQEFRRFIPELIAQAKKIEKVKKVPLDIEFVIAKGKLYWVQVRPMVNRTLNDRFFVWDNTNAEANYPGLTLPLSISFSTVSFETVYTAGAKAIGYRKRIINQNAPLIRQMSGEISGGLYYNVTAWQANLYQMPFGKKLSKRLTHLWGMSDAPYHPPLKRHTFLERTFITLKLLSKLMNSSKEEEKYHRIFNSTLVNYSVNELKKQTYSQLVDSYSKLKNEIGDSWLAPISNGFFTMVIFFRLKRYVGKTKLNTDYPNFVNDILFAEGDVVSVDVVRSFQDLLFRINEDKQLKELFVNHSVEEIDHQLKLHFPLFHEKMKLHIEKYGDRTSEGELKMETVTYKQDPLLFIQYLKQNSNTFIPNTHKPPRFEYEPIVMRYYPFNFVKRFILKKLVKIMIRRVKARENYRFMRTTMFALFRQLFMTMGEKLYQDRFIDNSRDVLYLRVEELMNAEGRSNFKEFIEQRKSEYENYKSAARETRYLQSSGRFFPVTADKKIALKDGQLKGVGCCSGEVTGIVLFINENTDLSQDFTGCILIANYFEPGWINLFSQAKGIISERGNLLSHTSIICRELGVPSIVGAKGIMDALKGKETVKMNGATGIIYLEEYE